MAALDALTQDVATETGVVQSAVTLINGLAQEIKDAGTDPAQLKALTDQMEVNAKAWRTPWRPIRRPSPQTNLSLNRPGNPCGCLGIRFQM